MPHYTKCSAKQGQKKSRHTWTKRKRSKRKQACSSKKLPQDNQTEQPDHQSNGNDYWEKPVINLLLDLASMDWSMHQLKSKMHQLPTKFLVVLSCLIGGHLERYTPLLQTQTGSPLKHQRTQWTARIAENSTNQNKIGASTRLTTLPTESIT